MTSSPDYQLAGLPRAGFMSRLGAAIYDSLLAFAVYSLAGIIGFAIIALLQQLGWITLASNEDLALALQHHHVLHGIYQFWLLCTVVSFYSYFWSRSGQTLGMKAWKLRVQHLNGQNISPVTAVARCFWSLLGAGNLLMLISPQLLALQDRLTESEVVIMPQ